MNYNKHINEGVKQVEETVADGIIDFDEISKEGQRISQELNKAKQKKKCGRHCEINTKAKLKLQQSHNKIVLYNKIPILNIGFFIIIL